MTGGSHGRRRGGGHGRRPGRDNGRRLLYASDRLPLISLTISGKGSHSRGQAALPVAIKSFLSEKGYYYYEARIGVITVQPKFRQLSTALLNR